MVPPTCAAPPTRPSGGCYERRWSRDARPSAPAGEGDRRARRSSPQVKATARIGAKRLLRIVRGRGYTGSERTLRAPSTRRRRPSGSPVTAAPIDPGVPVPGEHLVIDWGVIDGLHVFCAVLAWSRVRFVRFAEREDRDDAGHARGVLRGPRRRTSRGARRPDGLPRGWRGRQRGGAHDRAISRSPRTMGSVPTSARRRTQSPRASSRLSSATAMTTSCGRCCSSTPKGSTVRRRPRLRGSGPTSVAPTSARPTGVM